MNGEAGSARSWASCTSCSPRAIRPPPGTAGSGPTWPTRHCASGAFSPGWFRASPKPMRWWPSWSSRPHACRAHPARWDAGTAGRPGPRPGGTVARSGGAVQFRPGPTHWAGAAAATRCRPRRRCDAVAPSVERRDGRASSCSTRCSAAWRPAPSWTSNRAWPCPGHGPRRRVGDRGPPRFGRALRGGHLLPQRPRRTARPAGGDRRGPRGIYDGGRPRQQPRTRACLGSEGRGPLTCWTGKPAFRPGQRWRP